MAWKINMNTVILFKKSDFPLLNNISDYEHNMDLWNSDDQDSYYSPDDLIQSPGYRTYLFEKFRKNSKKDVRAYDTWVLLDSNNRNTLDFNISDYYMFLGYESQI